MKVVIRTDASVRIGTGHVMRCLTLAEALKARDATVSFICRELPGNHCDFLEYRRFPVYRLPYKEPSPYLLSSCDLHEQWLGVSWKTDAEETKPVLGENRQIDLLVVDHYALDIRWESMMRPHVSRIMVIDDLANRSHDCDLLLDQNLHEDLETRYATLIPRHSIALVGPEYAILRPEFVSEREHLRSRNGYIRRILVFFGGNDIDNATENALEAIRALGRPGIAVDAVVGAFNQNRQRIREICESMPNTTFHCQVSNMAELISGADLAIGAAGTSTWERCCLGLPSLIVSLARNQESIAREADRIGIGFRISTDVMKSPEKLKEQIEKRMDSPGTLIAQSRKCLDLVDGLGVDRILIYAMSGQQE